MLLIRCIEKEMNGGVRLGGEECGRPLAGGGGCAGLCGCSTQSWSELLSGGTLLWQHRDGAGPLGCFWWLSFN